MEQTFIDAGALSGEIKKTKEFFDVTYEEKWLGQVRSIVKQKDEGLPEFREMHKRLHKLVNEMEIHLDVCEL
jgi:hypothetical protein